MDKYTNVELESMDKDELIKHIEDCYVNIARQSSGTNRKHQVLQLLNKAHYSIKDLASELNIDTRNVSSVLSYLRKDGVKIATDSEGRKFIEDHDYTESDSIDEDDSIEDDDNEHDSFDEEEESN